MSAPLQHMTTKHSSGLRFAKIPLSLGLGTMPALGFGTLIPDPVETTSATTNALRVGFRHFDCEERYRNERGVGESLQGEFATGAIAREDMLVTTKLWNTNRRREPVGPAFEASRERLGLRYVNLLLIHTPFAFHPGDDMARRDQSGKIIYDKGLTLLRAWRAMASLVVLFAWAAQRGKVLLTTPRTAARARENFNISAFPEDALEKIDRIQTRHRLNEVATTGSPGFTPQGR